MADCMIVSKPVQFTFDHCKDGPLGISFRSVTFNHQDHSGVCVGAIAAGTRAAMEKELQVGMLLIGVYDKHHRGKTCGFMDYEHVIKLIQAKKKKGCVILEFEEVSEALEDVIGEDEHALARVNRDPSALTAADQLVYRAFSEFDQEHSVGALCVEDQCGGPKTWVCGSDEKLGSGFLDPDELGIFLQQKYGIVLDDAAQDDAAKAMDENESGHIDFFEFLEWWNQSAFSKAPPVTPECAAEPEAEEEEGGVAWHGAAPPKLLQFICEDSAEKTLGLALRSATFKHTKHAGVVVGAIEDGSWAAEQKDLKLGMLLDGVYGKKHRGRSCASMDYEHAVRLIQEKKRQGLLVLEFRPMPDDGGAHDIAEINHRVEAFTEDDKKLYTTFHDFDRQNTGFLDPDELGIFLQQKFGLELDDAQLDKATKELDENDDGHLNFFAFLDWWKNSEFKAVLPRSPEAIKAQAKEARAKAKRQREENQKALTEAEAKAKHERQEKRKEEKKKAKAQAAKNKLAAAAKKKAAHLRKVEVSKSVMKEKAQREAELRAFLNEKEAEQVALVAVEEAAAATVEAKKLHEELLEVVEIDDDDFDEDDDDDDDEDYDSDDCEADFI